jgi:hypothetical protein
MIISTQLLAHIISWSDNISKFMCRIILLSREHWPVAPTADPSCTLLVDKSNKSLFWPRPVLCSFQERVCSCSSCWETISKSLTVTVGRQLPSTDATSKFQHFTPSAISSLLSSTARAISGIITNNNKRHFQHYYHRYYKTFQVLLPSTREPFRCMEWSDFIDVLLSTVTKITYMHIVENEICAVTN